MIMTMMMSLFLIFSLSCLFGGDSSFLLIYIYIGSYKNNNMWKKNIQIIFSIGLFYFFFIVRA
jgi:hypothetical protein